MIVLDTSHYPICVVEFSEGTTEAQYQAYFAAQQAVSRDAIENNTYYVTVTVGGMSMSASDRKLMSEWVDNIPEEESARVLGSFVVIESTVMRGLLTAIKWSSKKLRDVNAMPSRQEAMAAASRLLESRGIEPPSFSTKARPS